MTALHSLPFAGPPTPNPPLTTGLPPEGCYLILSGPGSGKTTLLVERLAELLNTTVGRFRALALTFTNKAAKQMQERLAHRFSDIEERVDIGTFHNIAHKILRAHGHHLGLPSDFVIYDQQDSEAVLTELIENDRLPEDLNPRNLASTLSSLKSRGVLGLNDAQAAELPESLRRIHAEYQTALAQAGAVDFGDLIVVATRLLRENLSIARLYHRAYRYILVDEFQDTTPAQYQFLRTLVNPGAPNLFVVADEDQLIYEWNEARLETLNQFVDEYHARVDFRSLTYRCPRRVVQAANAVIQRNRLRFATKPNIEPLSYKPDTEAIFLYTAANQDDEIAWVIQRVKQLLERGCEPKEIAILARQIYPLAPIESALKMESISSRRARGGVLATEQGRFLVSLLRLATNPFHDTSLRRVLNYFAPALREHREKILRVVAEQNLSIEAVLSLVDTELSPNETTRLQHVMSLIAELRTRVNSANGAVEYLAQHWPELCQDLEEERTVFEEAITSLQVALRRNRLRTLPLPDFLDILHFTPEANEPLPVPGPGAVSILTCHQAKGLEFPVVFVVALEEGLFPDWRSSQQTRSLEEERRLFYVAITRTQEQLYLSYAQQRASANGSVRLRRPSQFIHEIPGELISLIE